MLLHAHSTPGCHLFQRHCTLEGAAVLCTTIYYTLWYTLYTSSATPQEKHLIKAELQETYISEAQAQNTLECLTISKNLFGKVPPLLSFELLSLSFKNTLPIQLTKSTIYVFKIKSSHGIFYTIQHSKHTSSPFAPKHICVLAFEHSHFLLCRYIMKHVYKITVLIVFLNSTSKYSGMFCPILFHLRACWLHSRVPSSNTIKQFLFLKKRKYLLLTLSSNNVYMCQIIRMYPIKIYKYVPTK